MTTSGLMVAVLCAAGCGVERRLPAFEDKSEKDPAKRLKPIQVHPEICLDCWRAGWRSDAPMEKDQPWRIYQLPGHPQVLAPAQAKKQ